MSDEPNPPADRPATVAGAAKALDFADKVRIGPAERKFRLGALELAALVVQAAGQNAALAQTLQEIDAKIAALTGGQASD